MNQLSVCTSVLTVIRSVKYFSYFRRLAALKRLKNADVSNLNLKMADFIDDLEYHVKFPPTTPKGFANKEKDDFVFVYDEEKLPVVVLFGWAGCQDKYLAKYSAIYEEKGCITLRCTSPVIVTFLRHDKLPKLGEKLLDLLHELSLDEHPIFFHIFSNGGAFFYQHVSLQMQKKDVTLHVKGVIFDSAPGERRFYSVYRALAAILGGSPWYNVPVSLAITTFLFLSFIIMAFLKGLLNFSKPQTDPIMLVDEPFHWPQLFIYSKNDELVRWEDVEKFAARREKKGVKVEKLCFTSSPHVQHLLSFRELYINTTISFLQECLKESSSPK